MVSFKTVQINFSLCEVEKRFQKIISSQLTMDHLFLWLNIGVKSFLPKLQYSKYYTHITALQAVTILVAIASEKKFWRPKFWWKSPIGPLQDPVTWYGINYTGTQKQRISYQFSVTFLCFKGPTASFASQCNLFRTMWLDPAKGLLNFDSQKQK